MEEKVKVIYCAGGTRQTSTIAVNTGFLYGSQLPGYTYFKPFFADQDWKNPDRERYMESLKELRPFMASVLDLERENQFDEVLSWAEEASNYVEKVIIVPKVEKLLSEIPFKINGKEVILGYSVPTKYGGTDIPGVKFGDRKVHLLGGLPHYQLLLYKYFNVYSIDNNYILLKGIKYNCFWSGGYYHNAVWKQMADVGLSIGRNVNYVAFAMSCANLIRAWTEIQEGIKLPVERPGFLKKVEELYYGTT